MANAVNVTIPEELVEKLTPHANDHKRTFEAHVQAVLYASVDQKRRPERIPVSQNEHVTRYNHDNNIDL